MPDILTCLDIISKTINNIMDFVASDETLEDDFKKYLEINNIEINTEKDFTNVMMQYLLDMKMQNGLRVLEYYRRNTKCENSVIDALMNSFCGVFKINKILSNAYDTTCLNSNAQITLIPMVKMHHLKQIGRNDFIKARIIEFDSVQYLLEIYDVISEYTPYRAGVETIRYMLQNPKSAHYKNKEKKELLKKSAQDFFEKFKSFFKKDYIITTNKKIDELIEVFNTYKETGEIQNYDSLIEKVEKNKFIKINELDCSDETFIENALGGFSSHKETYDTALWIDEKRGLYVIPFFETFLKCFKEDIEGKDECIREFLTNDKIPPSVLKYALNYNDNFFETVNSVLNTNFSNFEELLFNTKTAFIDAEVYSPIVILYNSELFSEIINMD